MMAAHSCRCSCTDSWGHSTSNCSTVGGAGRGRGRSVLQQPWERRSWAKAGLGMPQMRASGMPGGMGSASKRARRPNLGAHAQGAANDRHVAQHRQLLAAAGAEDGVASGGPQEACRRRWARCCWAGMALLFRMQGAARAGAIPWPTTLSPQPSHMPDRMLIVVVLPAPLWPSRAVIWPRGMSRLSPSTATCQRAAAGAGSWHDAARSEHALNAHMEPGRVWHWGRAVAARMTGRRSASGAAAGPADLHCTAAHLLHAICGVEHFAQTLDAHRRRCLPAAQAAAGGPAAQGRGAAAPPLAGGRHPGCHVPPGLPPVAGREWEGPGQALAHIRGHDLLARFGEASRSCTSRQGAP